MLTLSNLGRALKRLQSIRVNALFPGSVVVEFKYGLDGDDYNVALAGYAMALESFLEIPVDYGIAITINGSDTPRLSFRPVYISNAVRQRFVEARDKAIDIVLSENPPEKPSQCPATCPFRDCYR